MLLNIFHTGGLTLGLTLVWLVLTVIFGYQAVKAHNSGGVSDSIQGGHKEDNLKTPYTKIPQTWMAVFVTILYIVAMLVVASDYKGV